MKRSPVRKGLAFLSVNSPSHQQGLSRRFLAAVVSTVFAVAATPAPANLNETQRLPDSAVIVEVNGREVTVGDVRRRLEPLLTQATVCGTSPSSFKRELELIENQIIGHLVNRILIIDACHRDGFPEITETEAARGYLLRFESDFRTDADQLAKYMERWKISETDFLQEITEDLMIERLRKIIREDHVPVTLSDAKRYYDAHHDGYFQPEAVHLNLILLKCGESEDSRMANETALLVMTELLAGRDFTELAREFSQDSRRNQGGDWGWISRNDLRTELAEVAFDLEPNEFSEPVYLNNEIFILRLVEKREAGTQPFVEVREQILEKLTRRAKVEVEERWIENLRANASITYFDYKNSEK